MAAPDATRVQGFAPPLTVEPASFIGEKIKALWSLIRGFAVRVFQNNPER